MLFRLSTTVFFKSGSASNERDPIAGEGMYYDMHLRAWEVKGGKMNYLKMLDNLI